MSDFYAPQEVQLWLKLPRRTVIHYAKSRQLPGGVKVGAQWRFKAQVLDAWLIRRMISLISAVYTTVMDHELEGAPTHNPAKTFDRRFLKETQPVDQQLRPQHFLDVLHICKSEEHRRILVVLATTGMRAGELKGLVWEEVDLKNLVIEFGNLDSSRTKRGRSLRIPILPQALEALTAQLTAQYGPTPRGRPAGLVFPNPLTGEERA